MNELKAIREALDLSQAAMGDLYGVKQGVYQRWESAPNSRAGRDAMEKAKAIYRQRKKKEWELAPSAEGPYLTEKDFAEWRGYWRGGMEGVLKRLDDLEDQVRKLRQRAGSE